MKRHQKLVRYIMSGGIVAIIEYGTFLYLQYGCHFPVWVSQIVSFSIGLVAAFLLHMLWTFRGNGQLVGKKQQKFLLYVLLAIINVIITSIAIVILQRLNTPAWLAKVVVMGAVVVWNFIILNKVIFNSSIDQFLSGKQLRHLVARNRMALALFLLIVSLGGAVIAIIPQGVGHDEVAHVIKADAASRLSFVAQRHTFVDTEGREQTIFIHNVSPNLVAYSSYAYSVRTKTLTDENKRRLEALGAQSFNDEPRLADAWGAAGYPGVAYLPAAAGLKLARVAGVDVRTALYVGKVMTLLVNAMIITWAFLIVRRLAVRYVFFLFGCFLPVVAAASAISIDGLTISLALVVTAVMIRGWLDKQQTSGIVWYTSIGAAIVLPVIKLPYLLLSLGIILSGVGRYTHRIIAIGALLAAILLPTVGWNMIARDAHSVQSQRVACCHGPADPAAQLGHIVAQPVEYVVRAGYHVLAKVDFVNETGRITQQPQRPVHEEPLILYTILMVISAVMTVASIGQHLTRRHVAIASTISIATVFGIITALYVSANTPGAQQIWGVQARYFLPLWPLVMIACAGWLSLRHVTIFTQRTFWVIIGTCMICNAAMLLGYIG